MEPLQWPLSFPRSRFQFAAARLVPLRVQAARISASRAMLSAFMFVPIGITGHFSELLSRAPEAAIRSKTECISSELLQSVIGARTFA